MCICFYARQTKGRLLDTLKKKLANFLYSKNIGTVCTSYSPKRRLKLSINLLSYAESVLFTNNWVKTSNYTITSQCLSVCQKINAYKVLVGKSERRKQLWRHRLRVADNIKMGGCGLDSYGSGKGKLADFCDCYNEPWVPNMPRISLLTREIF